MGAVQNLREWMTKNTVERLTCSKVLRGTPQYAAVLRVLRGNPRTPLHFTYSVALRALQGTL